MAPINRSNEKHTSPARQPEDKGVLIHPSLEEGAHRRQSAEDV